MLPSFCTFRSDTSPNLMRFSCSENRWSNGYSNIIFSTRPIQNEIKISFISKHTHTIRSGHHGQCIRANELFWVPCSVHCYRLAMCMEHGHGIEPRQQPQMIHMLEVTIKNVHTLYENWPNAGRCTYASRSSDCISICLFAHFHCLYMCMARIRRYFCIDIIMAVSLFCSIFVHLKFYILGMQIYVCVCVCAMCICESVLKEKWLRLQQKQQQQQW